MLAKGLNQAGDTIVEVLIAIAIISAVIGGAFASSSRSLNATQQSKERDQGVRLIESQVERLKGLVANDDTPFNGPSSEFCVDTSQTLRALTGAPAAEANSDTFGDPPYPFQCVLDGSNNTYNVSSGSIPYYLFIERDPAGTSDKNLFKVTARWDRAGGGGREQASINYRLY